MAFAPPAPSRSPHLGSAAPHHQPSAPLLDPVDRSAAPDRSSVVVLSWPAEEHIRTQLRDRGIARLLVVDGDQALPIAEDPLEDWMFARSDDRELDRRVAALERRASQLAGPPAPPRVDEHDLLHHGGRWVALPPGEASLMRILLRRFGTCAPIEELAPVAGTRSSLRGRIKRLRERTEPLGITITTVRSRGFVLSLQP